LKHTHWSHPAQALSLTASTTKKWRLELLRIFSILRQIMKPLALDLIKTDRPLIIAHRGYSRPAPKNMLPAFRLALAAGVDHVELDIQETKDRQLIVFHDREHNPKLALLAAKARRERIHYE
jgi:glycerophosphoryl diester phosphodiesterase